MYVDSHAHLEGRQFERDREAVLARAFEAGVRTIVAIGNGDGPATADCGIKLVEQYTGGTADGMPELYATVGIHPHEARLAGEAAYACLTEWARHPKVIAWGEIGLDYHYDHSPRAVQREVFRQQLELAKAARLPIVIHCRPSDNTDNAWQDCFALLDEHWAASGLGGVMHCFTGEVRHATAALDLGFIISFAGNVTYAKAQNIREAAKAVPLDRIFIETDCPYLAPIPHRGKRNEPAFVVETASHVAELRGIGREELGERAAENFYRFFRLAR